MIQMSDSLDLADDSRNQLKANVADHDDVAEADET